VTQAEWRAALAPALTTTRIDDAIALIADPEGLKRRTIDLYRGVWDLSSAMPGKKICRLCGRRPAVARRTSTADSPMPTPR